MAQSPMYTSATNVRAGAQSPMYTSATNVRAGAQSPMYDKASTYLPPPPVVLPLQLININ